MTTPTSSFMQSNPMVVLVLTTQSLNQTSLTFAGTSAAGHSATATVLTTATTTATEKALNKGSEEEESKSSSSSSSLSKDKFGAITSSSSSIRPSTTKTSAAHTVAAITGAVHNDETKSTSTGTIAATGNEKQEKEGKPAGGTAVGQHAGVWPPLPKGLHPTEILGHKDVKKEEKKEEKMEGKEQKIEVTAAAAGKKDVSESKDESKSVPGLSVGSSGVHIGAGVRSSSSFVANAIAAVNDHKSFVDKDGEKDRGEKGREEKHHFKNEKEKQPLPHPISPSKKTLATDDNIPTADEPTIERLSDPSSTGAHPSMQLT